MIIIEAIQAANLREFCAFVNPRFEGGIPDFMDGILDFMENFNKFYCGTPVHRKVHWQNPKLKTL